MRSFLTTPCQPFHTHCIPLYQLLSLSVHSTGPFCFTAMNYASNLDCLYYDICVTQKMKDMPSANSSWCAFMCVVTFNHHHSPLGISTSTQILGTMMNVLTRFVMWHGYLCISKLSRLHVVCYFLFANPSTNLPSTHHVTPWWLPHANQSITNMTPSISSLLHLALPFEIFHHLHSSDTKSVPCQFQTANCKKRSNANNGSWMLGYPQWTSLFECWRRSG